MTDHVHDRLEAWAAGELDPAARAAVASHLEACAACRAEAHAWRALFERTAGLPRSIEPPRDLWPGIDAALDEPAAIPLRRPRLRPWWLAAAGVALVVATAALTTLFLRGSDTLLARKLKGMESPAGADPAVVDLRVASDDLLRRLEEEDVPPETIAIVQRNLAVIDVAIGELEAALARDPDNEELAEMLVSTHRKKAELIEGAIRAREES
jgi:putative zinc finger protein